MIYTRKGDNGTTSLVGGERVPKYDLRVECYGTVDELVSYLGLIRDYLHDTVLTDEIKKIQNTLFNVESILACETPEIAAKMPPVTEENVHYLEKRIDEINAQLPPLKAFIIPGGSRTSSHVHVARTICRRAERLCVRLNEEKPTDNTILQYINRLSDYLFVLSRLILKQKGRKESYWESE